MEILVNVVGQKLKIATNLKCFVSGSQQFVKFIFNMDSEWDNLTVFAQFKQNDVAYNQYLDNDNSVYLPSEISAGTCELILYGTGNDVRATTNYLTLTIDESVLVTDAQSTEITQSLYQQLVNNVKSSTDRLVSFINTVKVSTDMLQTQVGALDRIVQGITGVAPIVVSSMSEMVDTGQIYVLTTDNKWYYYDGVDWVAGGTYGVVSTDKTLTMDGIPADAKIVGDELAKKGTLVDEPLEDGEVMKYITVSKYDDFKLINGYGYFDAKMLINSICNSLRLDSGNNNYVFRLNVGGRAVLLQNGFNTVGSLNRIFASDFPLDEVEWGNTKSLGDMASGFYVSKDPNPIRTSVYITVPKSLYGESATFGDYMFNLMGAIGILMNTENIIEYNPSEAIMGATFGAISEATVEGELFYKGQININPLTNIIGISDTIANRQRVFSSFGFIDASNNYTTYAKEFINIPAGVNQSRFYYTVKASGVGVKTVDAIKDYLTNVRQLRFYYVAPEEVTA